MRQGAPYLEAWCHSSGGARLFRVDRITEAIELEEPAAPGGQRMDVDDLGLIRRAPGLLATLELHPAARWVTEEQPMTVLSESPDGTLTVEVPVSDRAWVVRLALRLGGRVRVLAPPDLVEEVSRAARAGLAALDG
jgi:proteasome accessory factor C